MVRISELGGIRSYCALSIPPEQSPIHWGARGPPVNAEPIGSEEVEGSESALPPISYDAPPSRSAAFGEISPAGCP